MRALLNLFRPGVTIYLPGATGEVTELADALASEPERMRDVRLVSCLLPGINSFDYAALDPTARLTVFLPSAALAASRAAGRVRTMPLAYSGIARWLNEAPLDIAVAHVAPPGADGRCSFGICADFSPIAWRRARRRVAVVNTAMPAMPRGPSVALADADLVIETRTPLLEGDEARTKVELAKIGVSVAALIPDGASIQFGIGSAPAEICSALGAHRELCLRSGFAPEGMRRLAEQGVLSSTAAHCVGIAAGSRAFYDWLAESDRSAFADVETTHDVAALSAVPSFYAINSAIEVDLFGQANLEWVDGHAVSGVGGAPDFTRAALTSPGGKAIIALPSTARGGAASRIVTRLDAATVSLPRSDIDIVVTEHGVAEVRNLTINERAQTLIAIADPEFHEDLARAWRELSS